MRSTAPGCARRCGCSSSGREAVTAEELMTIGPQEILASRVLA